MWFTLLSSPTLGRNMKYLIQDESVCWGQSVIIYAHVHASYCLMIPLLEDGVTEFLSQTVWFS